MRFSIPTIICSISLLFICHLSSAQTEKLILPDFNLVDLNGEKITLDSLVGKNVHVNFWSISCKPCIQEFPELNQLKASFDNQEFMFIAFAPESQEKISQLLDKKPLDYIIIPDSYEYMKQLGINAFPTNYFINKEGIVSQVIEGARFDVEIVDGKEVFVPDNYEIYEKALLDLE